MVDVDTFLTTLYVMVDDFGKTSVPSELHPGPQAALSRSEVVTLGMFGQWQGFGSERGFYRYAPRHLRAALPSLPTREQCNRQVRQQHAALVAFFLHLVGRLAAPRCPYEALESSGVPIRDAKRRGAGWLPGLADIGWSNRLGWYEGFHLVLAVHPRGDITGFGARHRRDRHALAVCQRRRRLSPQSPDTRRPNHGRGQCGLTPPHPRPRS